MESSVSTNSSLVIGTGSGKVVRQGGIRTAFKRQNQDPSSLPMCWPASIGGEGNMGSRRSRRKVAGEEGEAWPRLRMATDGARRWTGGWLLLIWSSVSSGPPWVARAARYWPMVADAGGGSGGSSNFVSVFDLISVGLKWRGWYGFVARHTSFPMVPSLTSNS